jgi:IS1 transposase
MGEDTRRLQKGALLQRFLGGVAGGDSRGAPKAVGKESGDLAHVERCNNTLRQRLARFVRKTLSFSKSDEMHEVCLKLFVYRYNTEIIRY